VDEKKIIQIFFSVIFFFKLWLLFRKGKKKEKSCGRRFGNNWTVGLKTKQIGTTV